MPDAHIRVSNLCFSWPDGTPVLADLSFNLAAARTGLVAPNGAGKSTLLRLLAGALSPSAGTISVQGQRAYLSQHYALDARMSVAGALGIAAKLSALDAILAGDADPRHFDTLDGDWDLRERSIAILARLGLGDVSLSRPLATLSGGEVTSLRLAAQLLRQPDVLLLDEPSNHLDRDARMRLHEVLADWSGCLLVASHDRTLLRGMTQIAELTPGHLHLHGGGYEAYRAAVDAGQRALEQQVRNLRSETRREKQQLQQARERAQRRAGNAARHLGDAGLPRIAAGNRQRAAQVSAGKADGVHAARLSQVKSRLQDAAQALDEATPVQLPLPATYVPLDRVLLVGEAMRVRHGERVLFGQAGVSLAIRGPERIALLGANGTGKTSLLRVLAGELALDAGQLKRGQGRVAYLSQQLDLLDPTRTVADNLADFTPAMPAPERAHLLARLQFRGSRMQLPLRALSGGERLRVVLACVLHAEPPPQLLLLDEPTNNLDLATIAELEETLRGYQGALMVVSHDAAFLDAIGVTRWLRLTSEGLQEVV